MRITGRARRSRGRRVRVEPEVRPEVAVLAGLPVGPRLGAALAGIDIRALTGYELVLVVQAWWRQDNYERGMFLAAVAELIRRTDAEHGRLAEPELNDRRKWNVAELRAALVLTRTAARSLAELAHDLTDRLPAVHAAMVAGTLDQPRARVFSFWTEELAFRHTQEIVKHLLPKAPCLTTGELIEAIQRAAIELDPRWARRRYENALAKRRVRGVLRPDGTADLSGTNLPADQVAAACDRLDALAHRLKQAGYPSLLNWIRADLFLGKLDGRYAGMTDDELFEHLMANPVPKPAPDPEPPTPDDQRTDEEWEEYFDYLEQHNLIPDDLDLDDPQPDSDHGDQPEQDGGHGESGDQDHNGDRQPSDPAATSDDSDCEPDDHGQGDDHNGEGHAAESGDDTRYGHGGHGRRTGGGGSGQPDHAQIKDDGRHERADHGRGADSRVGESDNHGVHQDRGHRDGLERFDDVPSPPDDPPGDAPGPGVAGPPRPDDDSGGGGARTPQPSTSDAARSDAADHADPPRTAAPPHPGPPDAYDTPGPHDFDGEPSPQGRASSDRPPGTGDAPSSDNGPGTPDTPEGDGVSDSASMPNADGTSRGTAAATSAAAGRVRGRGLRLLVGLATLAGLDRRPGELLGFGFVHAELARRISAARAASWYYALVQPDGTPIQVGPIRGRPAKPWAQGHIPDYHQLEVWLQLTPDDLTKLTRNPPPGWHQLLTRLARRIAHHTRRAPNGDPNARLPGRLLRRWLHIRDRRCVFPGCRIAPHRTDADHTTEYARGGLTTIANLGSLCRPDHLLRHEHGWQVRQTRPGRFVWTSPLGHHYHRQPPPGPADALTPMTRPTRDCENPILTWLNDDFFYTGKETCKTNAKPRRRRPEPPPPPTPLGDPPF